ncbi:hypothetical protein CO151_01755, partial [bacterium CG_4_9_14_3_um_filter_65_15]
KAELPPGTTFDQVITLKNIGSTAWDASWHLTREKGAMSQVASVGMPDVASGAEGTVTIPMVMLPGVFGGFNEIWQLRDADQRVVPIDGAATLWLRVHAIGDDDA